MRCPSIKKSMFRAFLVHEVFSGGYRLLKLTSCPKIDWFYLIWGIYANFAKEMAVSSELIFSLFLPLWDPGILRYNEAVYIIKRNSFGSNWLIKVSSVKQRLDNSSGNFKCFDHCWCLCVRNIWWHVLNHTKDNCRKNSKSNCSFSEIVLCTSCQLSTCLLKYQKYCHENEKISMA